MKYNIFLLALLAVVISLKGSHTLDLYYSPISPVTQETRYTTLNPDVKLTPFEKLRHVKGNFVFNLGDNITGQRLILTHLDEIQFTKTEDIEVVIRYPAQGLKGATITRIEIYVDLSTDDADAFLCKGGIDFTYAEILLASNQTRYFTYELFIYGY